MIALFAKDINIVMEQIAVRGLSAAEWAEIESCDMFQTASLCGGFDATETAFCFSLYANDTEYWFQFTLDDVEAFNAGSVLKAELREANA